MPWTRVVFYQENGRVPALEWLRRQSDKVQIKCEAYLRRLEQQGHEARRPTADLLRDGIYELRPSFQGVNYRILYFFGRAPQERGTDPGEAVVVVSHGLAKEREVPAVEIQRALERKRKYEADPKTHIFNG